MQGIEALPGQSLIRTLGRDLSRTLERKREGYNFQPTFPGIGIEVGRQVLL